MAKIESISKFGFVADGIKYKYEDVLVDRVQIVPGAIVELNKSIERNQHPSLAPDTERAKKFTPKYEKKDTATSAGLTKDEWAAKDRRISRQGCIQVAVQVMSDFEQAKELAEKMLEFVNS